MHRLVASFLFVAAMGCVADSGDESFLVRNNLAAPAESCTIEASIGAPFISRGTIAIVSPQAYLLTPLIESRITALAGQESQRTIFLQGARVDLAIGPITVEDPVTGAVTNVEFTEAEIAQMQADGIIKFKTLFSAPLEPNGGLSTASFDLVPTRALTAIRTKVGAVAAGSRVSALIVATSTVFGLLGDDEIEGVPFVYPVTACNDCVIREVGPCPLPMGTMVAPGNSCNMFQDGVVDCCTNAENQLVCPATVATSSS